MATKASERAAAKIREIECDKYERDFSMTSEEQYAKIIDVEIAATIERCAQIADKFGKDEFCYECCAEDVAAAIRSMGDAK